MGNIKTKFFFPWKFSVFCILSSAKKNGTSHPGQPTNLLCPFLVPQCSTYLPTQNRDVINGCSLSSLHQKILVHNTVTDGRKITYFFWGEYKVITTEQQFLGLILCFFMHLRWPWLSRFFREMLQKLFKFKIIEI